MVNCRIDRKMILTIQNISTIIYSFVPVTVVLFAKIKVVKNDRTLTSNPSTIDHLANLR